MQKPGAKQHQAQKCEELIELAILDMALSLANDTDRCTLT